MTPGRMVRGFAWAVVALRHLIVPAWIAAAVAAALYLPGLGESSRSPMADLVPTDSEAAKVAERSTELFGFPLFTDTAVVQHAPQGLTARERRHTLEAARRVTERPARELSLIRGALPIAGERSAVTYLYFAPEAGLEERDEDAHKYASSYLGPNAHVVGVTGAAPARLAQFEEIESSLPLIEIASVLVIALIVGLHFRTLAAPLVTLAGAAISYVVATRVLAWIDERTDLTVAQEVQPLVLVLLLGLVTDYSVFFMSSMRRALREEETVPAAARAATAGTTPLVVVAGLIVAGGVAALAVGRLEFFQAFGPSLAITTLVGLVVAITLVPAAMTLAGKRLPGHDEAPSRRGRPLAHAMAARPAAFLTVVLAVVLLLVPATGLAQMELGLGFIRTLPDDSEAKQAAVAAGEEFPPGIISPGEVLLEARGLQERREQLVALERLLGEEPGVAAVVGPGQQVPEPVPNVFISEGGGAARYGLVFDVDPLGANAIDRLDSIRSQMPGLLGEVGLGADTSVRYGGETALADETVDLMTGDLSRIAVVALAVNILLLALFMRALVAPFYLVGASVLGLAATLGLTVYASKYVLGSDELTYYVPFAASVLLVSLGSDYNVFVAGRIWAEAEKRRRLREAIAVAAPAAARAITVAGLALAASFALLAIVPLRSFHEFAFVMAAGILIDTFIVRPLLIPGLMALFGDWSWRPGSRRIERAAGRPPPEPLPGGSGRSPAAE